MNIQLIDGVFNVQDALDITSKMIRAKITFHEGMIRNADLEEDMEYRERRIRALYESLDTLRDHLKQLNGKVVMKSFISIDQLER